MKNQAKIYELSEMICKGCKTRHDCKNNDGFCIMSEVVAEYLIDNGYGNANQTRKDTAKEIFDDIKYGFENTPYYRLNPQLVFELKTILLHIAKKYGLNIEKED